MGKSSPKSPDPVATAAAQTGTNVMTANANTLAQNGNVTTADGTRTTNFRTQDIVDPYTGKTNKVYIPDVTETLSAPQQAIKTQQDAASLNLSTLGNKQSQFLGEYLGDGASFKYDNAAHNQWASGLFDQINGDDRSRQVEDTRTRLANQGIRQGSALYDREMANLNYGQNKSRNDFLLNSQQQGFDQALTTRNQPINEILGLLRGSGVQQPTFNKGTAGNVATTDTAGIIQQDYQNRVNAANQKNAAWGGLFSGIGSAAMALSDRRAKKNIRKVGKTNDGQKIYSYHYKGESDDAPLRMGLMAQEVAKRNPRAVAKLPSGLMAVDYSQALHMGA